MRPPIIIVSLALIFAFFAGCADKNEQAARIALTQWLDAHVARDFKKVVALTADDAFAAIAKQHKVPMKEIRRDIPGLLKLTPEKLESYSVDEKSRKVSDKEYVFNVEQKTVKQKKRATKKEEVFVVLEKGRWCVNPTRTKPAKASSS